MKRIIILMVMMILTLNSVLGLRTFSDVTFSSNTSTVEEGGRVFIDGLYSFSGTASAETWTFSVLDTNNGVYFNNSCDYPNAIMRIVDITTSCVGTCTNNNNNTVTVTSDQSNEDVNFLLETCLDSSLLSPVDLITGHISGIGNNASVLNDQTGDINITILLVEDTISPIITIQPPTPSNASEVNISTQTFNFTIYEDVGNLTINFTFNDVSDINQITSGFPNITFSSNETLIEGNNTWSIKAIDSADNSDSLIGYFVTLIVIPTPTITSPTVETSEEFASIGSLLITASLLIVIIATSTSLIKGGKKK